MLCFYVDGGQVLVSREIVHVVFARFHFYGYRVYQDLSDDLNEAQASLFRSSLTLLSQLRVAG